MTILSHPCYLGKPSKPPMVKDLTKKNRGGKKRICLYKLQIEQIEWRFYNLWSHLKYSTMLDTDEKNNKGFKEPQTSYQHEMC